MVDLKLNSVLSAKQACILAFWAKGVGMVGNGCLLALSPQDNGGQTVAASSTAPLATLLGSMRASTTLVSLAMTGPCWAGY